MKSSPQLYSQLKPKILIWTSPSTFLRKINQFRLHRRSHRRCSIKKAVHKNFAIFIGKCLYWNLFLNRLQAFRLATLSKIDSNTGVIPVNIAKFLRTSILKNICGRPRCVCFYLINSNYGNLTPHLILSSNNFKLQKYLFAVLGIVLRYLFLYTAVPEKLLCKT